MITLLSVRSSFCLSRQFFSRMRGGIKLKFISNSQMLELKRVKKIKKSKDYAENLSKIFETRNGTKIYTVLPENSESQNLVRSKVL